MLLRISERQLNALPDGRPDIPTDLGSNPGSMVLDVRTPDYLDDATTFDHDLVDPTLPDREQFHWGSMSVPEANDKPEVSDVTGHVRYAAGMAAVSSQYFESAPVVGSSEAFNDRGTLGWLIGQGATSKDQVAALLYPDKVIGTVPTPLSPDQSRRVAALASQAGKASKLIGKAQRAGKLPSTREIVERFDLQRDSNGRLTQEDSLLVDVVQSRADDALEAAKPVRFGLKRRLAQLVQGWGRSRAETPSSSPSVAGPEKLALKERLSKVVGATGLALAVMVGQEKALPRREHVAMPSHGPDPGTRPRPPRPPRPAHSV